MYWQKNDTLTSLQNQSIVVRVSRNSGARFT
jgi:hypothetical protein